MIRLLISLVLTITCCSCSLAFSSSQPGKTAAASGSHVLSLQEAVRMAMAQSPDVLIAEAQTLRAGESLRESRSLNLPQIYAGTGLAYNNGFPLSIEGSAPAIFKISGSKSILSRRNANLIRGAEASITASRHGTDAVKNELAGRTAMVYYELFQALKMIELASERLEVAVRQQELVEISVEAGKALPMEAALAVNATAAAEQELLVAQEQARIAEAELRELTGLRDDRPILPLEPDISGPVHEMSADELYRKVLSQNPEILQAEVSIKAAEYTVEAEKGDRLPQINLVSEYALFSRSNNFDDFYNRFDRHNYLFGLSVQVPLFDGFRTSARVAQSRQTVSEEQYRLQRVKSDLKLAVQRRVSTLKIARGARDLARSDMETARSMVEMNTTLLESGRISMEELNESRIQLRRMEIALLETDQALFQRELDLLQITGSLVSALE
jgi:outer membrane protein